MLQTENKAHQRITCHFWMVGTGQGGCQVILCILCVIYVSQNEIIIMKSLHSGRHQAQVTQASDSQCRKEPGRQTRQQRWPVLRVPDPGLPNRLIPTRGLCSAVQAPCRRDSVIKVRNESSPDKLLYPGPQK